MPAPIHAFVPRAPPIVFEGGLWPLLVFLAVSPWSLGPASLFRRDAPSSWQHPQRADKSAGPLNSTLVFSTIYEQFCRGAYVPHSPGWKYGFAGAPNESQALFE